MARVGEGAVMEPFWRLEQFFGIDEGQLEGETPQRVFVYGVEFGRLYEDMSHGYDGGHTVHRANLPRLNAMARKVGIELEVRDVDEEFVELCFHGRKGERPQDPDPTHGRCEEGA